MANTGFDWGDWELISLDKDPSNFIDNYKLVGTSGVVTSGEVSLDIKAGCEISCEVEYDGTAQGAGLGTSIYVARQTSSENYDSFETVLDGAWGVMLAFGTGAGDLRKKVFAVDPGSIGSFKIIVTNTNTAGSTCYITCRYRTADIPAAN